MNTAEQYINISLMFKGSNRQVFGQIKKQLTLVSKVIPVIRRVTLMI